MKIVDMLEALHFMSIQERMEYNVCIIVYKIMKGLCPKYLQNKIEVVQHVEGVRTRQIGNIYSYNISIDVRQVRNKKCYCMRD